MTTPPNRRPPARPRTSSAGYDPKPVVSDAVLDIAQVDTVQQFVAQLKALVAERRLSTRQIADAAGAARGMSRSTVSSLLNTTAKLPRRATLVLFLKGCSVSSAEQTLWLAAHKRLSTSPAPEASAEETHENVAPAPEPASPPEQSETATEETVDSALPPEPGTADPEPGTAGSPETIRPRPLPRYIHLVAALTVLIIVVTASTVVLSLAQVPRDLVILCYATIALSVISWTAVNRAFLARVPPPPPFKHTDDPAYGDFYRTRDIQFDSGIPRTAEGNARMIQGMFDPAGGSPPKATPPVIGL